MAIDDKASRTLPELIEAGDTAESLYAELRAAFDEERAKLASAEDLKAFRDRWMGRKNGLLAAVNDSWLKSAPRELKPIVGKLQNQTKKALESALVEAQKSVEAASRKGDDLDVTLPGPVRPIGAKHPIRLALEEILDIFRSLGYSVAEGPEIETFFYNFEALNFPPDHPAVDEMDTLFIEDRMLLRTHTSPNQIRIMESLGAAAALRRPRQGLPQRRGRTRRTARCSTSSRCLLSARTITLRRPQGHARALRQALLRRAYKDAFPPKLFPFHRAQR